MIFEANGYAVLVLLVGVLVVVNMFVRGTLQRSLVPSLVVFLAIGAVLALVRESLGEAAEGFDTVFHFLRDVGLVVLLFRVGLESDLRGLVDQLRSASVVWAANFVGAGLAGVAAAKLMGLPLPTALIIGTAFTATSVGISVAVWQDQGALRTEKGSLLLDLAELDDITAVVLMALLFAVLPVIHAGGDGWGLLFLRTGGLFALKLAGFVAFCWLFSTRIEARLTGFLRRCEPKQDVMLSVAAMGFCIAALAALLGFSFAIGAFFAGLAFSRDPETVKLEGSFLPIYEFFAPFFFIGIGLDIEPGVMGGALVLGGVLLGFAVVGKIIPNGLPVWLLQDRVGAALIAVSMVPRAEITLVIMQRGKQLGEWAVTKEVYGAMVLVCAATCLVSPAVLNTMFRRWPVGDEAHSRRPPQEPPEGRE
jgi:Kef-type K+ transport system membrane component KefB